MLDRTVPDIPVQPPTEYKWQPLPLRAPRPRRCRYRLGFLFCLTHNTADPHHRSNP